MMRKEVAVTHKNSQSPNPGCPNKSLSETHKDKDENLVDHNLRYVLTPVQPISYLP